MRNNPYHPASGFTLLELSLVLVIVGLLLGMALNSGSVIKNARSQQLALEVATLGSALQTYQELYLALPGDDPAATGRWPQASGGNGDGVISGSWITAGPGVEEAALFWSHLRFAGLIPGKGSDTNPPRNPMGGRTEVLEYPLGLPGRSLCMSAIPADLAIVYDLQFDDGQGDSGRARGSGSKTTFDAPTPYAFHTTLTLCTLL